MTTIRPETLAAFDQLLQADPRSKAPGYIIGIASRGQTVYRRANGLASVEFGIPNTPETRVRIASVTKQFTGLAVMLLVEDGKLDIDRSVRSYLPELSGPNGTPTLRQLLNHTSGLRDALESVAYFLTDGLFPQIPAGLTHQWSSRFSDANFAPGTAWSYSNYGYMLLSLLIEKTSGMTFADFLRQRIFVPLGMNDSALVPDDMELSPGLAASHVRMPDGRYRRGIYPCAELVGGGGITSTIDDMLRWATQLREPRQLGTRASWDEILRPVDFGNGAVSTYGFGIKRQIHRGTELLWHDGSTFGSKCALMSFPEHALDIVVLANGSDCEPSAVALKIVDALLAGTLAPPRVAADAAGRESLVGNFYSATARRLFGLKAQDGKLVFEIEATPQGGLRDEGSALHADSTAGPLVVHSEAADPATGIELAFCGRRERYLRLPDTAPAVADLASGIVGEYRLADFDKPVRIVFDQGQLQIDLCSPFDTPRMLLTPLSTEVLLCTVTLLGAQAQGTVKLERRDGAVSGFFFSLQRTWNLYFRRVAG